MKPKIVLRSSFLSWLRRAWARAFAPEQKTRKRYSRETCQGCGKFLAVRTSGHVWPHKCKEL